MKSILAASLLLAVCSVSAEAVAAPKTLKGKIARFECGDNCYLILTDKKGEEHTGLCSAPECDPWNEVAEMPAKFVGRKVTVTIEQGQQTDADGNVMGEMDAYTSIKFN